MGLFLIFIAACLCGFSGLPERLAIVALPIHRACVDFTPESPYRQLYAALVCGADLAQGSFKENLRSTGLLHLIVVSGSHLIWLESALSWLGSRIAHRFSDRSDFIPNFIVTLICISGLSIFSLAANLQPPVVRAAASLSLVALSRLGGWQWSRLQIALLSGFVSLGLFPKWLDSFSLLFSWTAALALASLGPQTGVWRRQVRVYICMLICLLPLSPPHPLSIAFNVIAGPILGLFLFPASLLAWFVHSLTVVVDPVFLTIENLIEFLARLLPSQDTPVAISKRVLWIYLWSLNLGLAAREVIRGRQ